MTKNSAIMKQVIHGESLIIVVGTGSSYPKQAVDKRLLVRSPTAVPIAGVALLPLLVLLLTMLPLVLLVILTGWDGAVVPDGKTAERVKRLR